MEKFTRIQPVREIIRRSEKGVYFVGGCVRDFLLGRETTDIDIAVEDPPEKLLKPLKFFALDKERKIYRIVYGEYTIDVAKIQGNSIEEDLRRRDFTVNAVAFDVKKSRFLDPTGGLKDLKLGRLKVVSEANLIEDPIRILRAFRFWLLYPFNLDRETKELLKRHSHLIRRSAPERVKEELFKILNHPFSHKAFFLMRDLNVLTEIFPELKSCIGVFQGKFSGADLFDHLLYTLQAAERLIPFIDFFFKHGGRIKEILNTKTEQGMTRKGALKLACLFHDIAKPQTFSIRDGSYTFWGHDREGARLAESIGERLRLSNRTVKTVSLLVENHMRLHLLARAGEITDKAKGRFFRQLGEDGIVTVLLSLSDSLASSGNVGFFYLLFFAKQMVDFYFDVYLKKESFQKPILSGYDVMDILKIEPGPLVGRVLKALLNAQMEGKVKTKEEAIKFVEEEFGNG